MKIKYKKNGVFETTNDLVVDIGAAIFKIEEDGNKLKVIKLYPEKPIENIDSASGVSNITYIS